MVTADWHLGRTLGGKSLLPFQRKILEVLVREAVERAVDWFVIAGDVYDRRRPTAEDMHVLESLLAELHRNQINILVIGGNHDGEVLTLYSSLLGRSRRGTAQILLIDSGYPERASNSLHQKLPVKVFQEEGYAVYAMPYVDRRTCLRLLQGEGGDGALALHSGKSTEEGQESPHVSLLDLYLRRWIQRLPPDENVILVTHILPAKVVSSLEAGVEEVVGQMMPVDEGTFAPLLAVFAGHLHRRQTFAHNLYFAGAPYHLHYTDSYQPGALVVDLGPKGLHIEFVNDLPPLFERIWLRAPEEARALKNTLPSDRFVILTIEASSEGATLQEIHEVVQEAIQGVSELGSSHVLITFSGDVPAPTQMFTQEEALTITQTLQRYTPLDLIRTYVREMHNDELSEQEIQILQEVLEQTGES